MKELTNAILFFTSDDNELFLTYPSNFQILES